MGEKHSHTVEFLGTRLAIKTAQSAQEFTQVADLLRDKLTEVQRSAGAVDSLRVALLAGLDAARELLAARRELEALRDATAERTLALVERLEAETADGAFGDKPLEGDKRDKPILV
jgi:cell division protein ZapA (FtsZ GTPase activity inhibitor)